MLMVHTNHREWLWLWLFRAVPQRLQWISQLHHKSDRWYNQCFICECWN
jgi:hypothetical protein